MEQWNTVFNPNGFFKNIGISINVWHTSYPLEKDHVERILCLI